MGEQQKANYVLTIEADSGYSSTTEGRCTADQYGQAIAALHGESVQRTWVGLTDEEIEKGRDQTFSINNPYCPCDSKTMRKAARWVEAKLKEKNT